MNNLAQYLAYSQPQTGQSAVSPLAAQLMQKPMTHWAQLLGNLAMVGADKYKSDRHAETQADSIARLLAGDPMTSEAAAGVPPLERTGATQTNPNYDKIYGLLMDNPQLAPFFQAQALEKQYPDMFSEPQDLQPIYDPATGNYVYGTPKEGAVAKPAGNEWQNAGGGVLYRQGAGGQLEFQRAPGSGGGAGAGKWDVKKINGVDMWVNEATREIKPIEGAAPPQAATSPLYDLSSVEGRENAALKSMGYSDEQIIAYRTSKTLTNPATGETLNLSITDLVGPPQGAPGGGGAQPEDGSGPPVVTKQMTVDQRKREQTLKQVGSALDQYDQLVGEMDFGSRLGAAVGVPNPKMAAAQSAYQATMLQLKELFNLGVLNGPDYMIMQKMIVDPTNLTSMGVGPDGLRAQIDQVRKMLDAAVSNAGLSGKVPTGGAPSGGVLKYNPATGLIE